VTGSDRFVVLGLATPRAGWFTDVARWSTSGAIAVEFLKCLSVDELVARLRSGRAISAVVVDGGVVGLDRDLLATVTAAGAPLLVVDGNARRGWTALGAAAVLPEPLDRSVLLDALAAHARVVDRVTRLDVDEPGDGGGRAVTIAVCGPGGTGASSTAAALAEGLGAADDDVLLADLARNAEQAVLHDVGDVVPGVLELVESHRGGWPSDEEVRAATWELPGRPYRLLLGLRRSRHWSALRPRAAVAAFDALRRTFDAVVCDVDPDLEGDDQRSPDLADRNVLARTALARSDVVLVVARPGTKGTHSLLRVLTDLGESVEPARLVPVVVGAPRAPGARAEQLRALAALCPPAAGGAVAPALLLPERKVDASWRDGTPLPAPLPRLLAGAVSAVLERVGPRPAASADPELVRPGSLGFSG
jgi:hypothetical protein